MSLEIPESFDFPFTPYPIQHEFMAHLYNVIENKNLEIGATPKNTSSGTGQNLSMLNNTTNIHNGGVNYQVAQANVSKNSQLFDKQYG